MTYTFARRNAGEYNNVRLILGLLGLFFLISVAILSRNFYYNAIRGPFDVTPRDLLNLKTLDGLTEYYVRVQGSETYHTGYQYVEKHSGVETSHDSFVALQLEDRFLLIKVPGDPVEGSSYIGTLTPIDSEVQREVVDKLISKSSELTGRFLPYMMEQSDLLMQGIVSMLLMVVLIAGLIWMVVLSLLAVIGISGKPQLAFNARIGDEKEVLAQVSGELNQRHTRIGREFHLTRNWLVQNSAAYISVIRSLDVVWVYIDTIDYHSTWKRKLDLAIIYDRYGNKLMLPASKKQVKAIIDTVLERAPWAAQGYKPEWDAIWHEDRNKFILAVDRRRVLMHTS
jgi:hypothetical protein